jgi:GNAT superfamily N-acetyltransferase
MATHLTLANWALLEVSDPREIDEICRFRARVWLATPGTSPRAFPAGEWRDEIDANARHWVVRAADGSLVAAARQAILEDIASIIEPAEYLRYGLHTDGRVAAPDRVVVAPAVRSMGLAGRLLDEQHRAAKAAGAVCAARQASPRMVQLLVRRGWQILGPAGVDSRFPGTNFSVAIYVHDASRVRWHSCDEVP